MPDIKKLPAFFTDPDEIAGQLYEEFARQFNMPIRKWDHLVKVAPKQAQRWRAIARLRDAHQN